MPNLSQADLPPGQQRAWASPAAHLRLWLVTVAVLAADLWSKHAAFARLGEPGQLAADGQPRGRIVVEGLLRLDTQYNEGAALGILQGYGVLFVLVGAAALAFFLVMFAMSLRRQWALHLGVGLVLAGAIGNIYDRLAIGKVRDFLHITLQVAGREVWPWVFNIADVALVVGIGLIMLSWIRQGHRPRPEQGGASDTRTRTRRRKA